MPAKTVLDTRALLALLTTEPVSPADLMAKLDVSRQTLYRKLNVLVDEGFVVQEGQGPASTYRLKRPDELVPQLPVPPDAPRKVFLEMSEQTADRVYRALDFFTRIGIGQFAEVLDLARMGTLKRRDGLTVDLDELERGKRLLDELKYTLLGFAPGASHGVHSQNVSPEVQEMWVLAKALRHRLAWDRNPEGNMMVSYDEPLDFEDVSGFEVWSGQRPPQLVDLSELPAGMMLQHKAGKYRVVGPTADGEAFELVAESRSWQTAITRAKNRAAGGPSRSVSF